MSFLGADTESLVDLEAVAVAHARRLQEIGRDLAGVVSAVSWEGPDADAFRDAARPCLADLIHRADRVRDLGRELGEQAGDQDRASAPDSESPAGSGAGEVRGAGRDDESLAGESGSQVRADDGDLGGSVGALPSNALGDVPTDDSSLSPENLAQGRYGDCFLLASLGAIGDRDPDFLREHVHEKEKGVYDVELYDKNGKPVHQIVDSRAEDGVTGEDGKPTLMSVYESAYLAQHGGDESALKGGNSADAMQNLTGLPARETRGENRPNLEEMDQMLRQNRLLVAGTGNGDEAPSDPRIIGGHAYTVKSVDKESGTVTLVNPWKDPASGGGHQEVQQTVTMPYDEYQKNFVALAEGGTRWPSITFPEFDHFGIF